MVKVNKTFSLSPKAIQLIEKHVHDPHLGKVQSRSAVVERALLWYLDKRFKPFDEKEPNKDWEYYDCTIAELEDSQQKLMAKVRELAMRGQEEETASMAIPRETSWWRRLLGLN